MPIKSYLVYPHEGRKSELIRALSQIIECDVMPAQNEELLILVTETDNKDEEELLKEKLEAIESLKLLSMVSGFNTPQNS